MNWVHTPAWLRKAFPQLVWEIPTLEKEVYLTFDDGPTPEVTSQVLAFLWEYRAKATFFCQGSKIEQNQGLVDDLKAAGHTIGNHGYRHVSGFTTSLKEYLDNARKGAEISGSRMFRPPYGRITPWQIDRLKRNYPLVMWSIMSMDFNPNVSPAQCFHNVIKNMKPGAIIVFHDSEKARKNVLQVLPELLQWMERNGYKAKPLEEGFWNDASRLSPLIPTQAERQGYFNPLFFTQFSLFPC